MMAMPTNDEIRRGLDDDGGQWEPAELETRVSLITLACVVVILAASIVAGWLWPL
jgi:fatty acid desaturase